jgi:hypothetical protein
VKFSVKLHCSLPKVAVTFAELNKFGIFAENDPTTTSPSIIELRAIRVDDDSVIGQGVKQLLM